MANPYVLILFYSRGGGTANLAKHVARGVRIQGAFEARLRTVPPISAATEQTMPSIPDDGAVYCSKDDLAECSALALGSPAYFGNMAAPLKHFIDATGDLWMTHRLVGKPAAAFCSSGTLHGGQETTLMSMMVPLFHHGMLLLGLPYTEPMLHATVSGGTPYGASHVSGEEAQPALDDNEKHLAFALGRRLADVAGRLGS